MLCKKRNNISYFFLMYLYIMNFINKLSPETRTLVIIFLFGYVLYIQIADSTKAIIKERFQEEILCNKKAENYSMETSIDINR